ncbi:hypothetical protein BRC82_10650 [Halobacteriales archaeon QS_1_67_19]|nr:MAG: hypothetical protein BRC82_10650 [Halobacteriales archaeon QS_1_67_19]
MPDPSRLRDSTQIVLRADALEGIREDLTAEFTVTVTALDETPDGEYVRIIGSPVEIKAASDFLSRRGVALP